jgi:hypothetical protein
MAGMGALLLILGLPLAAAGGSDNKHEGRT